MAWTKAFLVPEGFYGLETLPAFYPSIGAIGIPIPVPQVDHSTYLVKKTPQ